MIKALMMVLLLASTHAFANEVRHVEFSASSNQDPIFIEKCDIYRDAKLTGNKQVLLQFVEEKFRSEKFKSKLDKRLTKVSTKYQGHFEGKDLKLVENRMSPDAKQNYASTIVKWRAEKASFREGCTFKQDPASGNWRIVLS